MEMLIEHGSEQHSLIHFSSEWEVLGPFQIGTRGEIAMLSSFVVPE